MGEEAKGKKKAHSHSDDVPAPSSLPPQQPPHNSAPQDTSNDAALARVEAEKILALSKAWEESKKTKVENRANKMHSAVGFWEDSKKACVEAKLKRIEGKLERKKGGYVEKRQNKIADIHRYAEEKRAKVEAQREEELVKVEEAATKFRTRGYSPRMLKLLPCFRG